MKIRRTPPNPSVKVANLEYSIPHEESNPKNILEEIIWSKDREVKIAKERITLEELKSKIDSIPRAKDFIHALKTSSNFPAIIAEIKKASPSKGIIRKDFQPIQIARDYQKAGASCLSVLTDKQFFQGGFDILIEVRKSVDIPILCKDFILTPYQIYQARAAGADAILLIAAILSDKDLYYLNKVAKLLGLSILVEVHNEEELERVIAIGQFSLIGINNRDLTTFETDIQNTQILAKKYSKQISENDILLVSESGLFTHKDLKEVYSAGAKAVLIGEALMKQDDICFGLKKLIIG